MRDYPTQVMEPCFYPCYTFHSHSSIFNNEHNLYSKMSVKVHVELYSNCLFIKYISGNLISIRNLLNIEDVTQWYVS